MRRTLATVVVLALPGISASPLLAAQPAGASSAKRATVYCIPPSTPGAAATENAGNTGAILSKYTEGSLANAGAASVPVGAPSAGTIAIKLTHGPTSIGAGGVVVTKSGCSRLTITLTQGGKQLLKRDEASKTPISILIASKFTPKGSSKTATATKTVTLKP